MTSNITPIIAAGKDGNTDKHADEKAPPEHGLAVLRDKEGRGRGWGYPLPRPDFRHAADELVTVLDGQMEFEVAGQVHHPQVREEPLIPADAVHSARNVGSTTARWLSGYARLG